MTPIGKTQRKALGYRDVLLCKEIVMKTSQRFRRVTIVLLSLFLPACVEVGDEAQTDFEEVDAIESLSVAEDINTVSSALSGKPFVCPLTECTLTYGFKGTQYGCAGKYHLGSDLQAAAGTAVYAPYDGVVKETHWRSGYGGTVIIEHNIGGTKLQSLLAHLSCGNKSDGTAICASGMQCTATNVKPGDSVTKGVTKIGVVAPKGTCSNGNWSPHVHWGVHKGAYNGWKYETCLVGGKSYCCSYNFSGYAPPCNSCNGCNTAATTCALSDSSVCNCVLDNWEDPWTLYCGDVDTPCTASVCNNAGPFSGSGANGGSGATCLNSYSFDVIQGNTYKISTCGNFSGDSYLKVTDACSCSNDDTCGYGSECTCIASSTGTATICASTYKGSAATWKYTVTATCNSPGCSNAGPFNGDGANGGSGATCLSSYNFNTVAGKTYQISTCGSFGGDPYLKVIGSCTCTNDDLCGLGSQCTCTATSTGTATICASTYGGDFAYWSYNVTCL
ncbi:MAG: hypothetical protein A3I74_05255 [Candidatus Magasanikbacteria bacterium RIFCSPLOWO2_02_FULL_47_16]|nr:MAG: hypothetical protein A3I74_05255 [Candidatus Magasanikbacteria bacterium RIFCSPLOWO2_02_FULL_47_16]